MRFNLAKSFIVPLLAILSGFGGRCGAAEDPFQYKWVYLSNNFIKEKNVDDSIEVLKKAAKAGYNGVFLTDCKFERWFDTVTVQRPLYDNNVKKLRQACRDLNLKVFVTCCAQGTDLLSVDPNLAEGVPVNAMPFEVRGGKIVAVNDLKLQNGSFEESSRPNEPAGWTVDEPGKIAFIDMDAKSDGKASLRFDFPAEPRNGRAMQHLTFKPFHYYHLTARIKTEGFTSPRTFDVKVIGKQQVMHQWFDIEPTQDWKTIDVVFNTFDNSEGTLYIGAWGPPQGKLWIDDIKIEAGGFVNLIRRDDCPLVVKSADGQTTYVEGKDFSPIKDPKMGNTDWPGLYKYWYEQPVVSIPAGSALKEGDTVNISYTHTMNTFGWGVFACMNHPKVLELAGKNLKELHTILQPDGYVLPYDEIRVCGWDGTYQKSGKTPLQAFTENIKACVAMVKYEDPGKPICVWNDMFDPYHNAGKKNEYYYLVKGIDPWYGACDALDKDVIIANWNSDAANRKPAMKFFDDRGHPQILCGFYDASSDNMTGWLAEGADIKSVRGVMYTTWGSNYSELDKFLKVCSDARK
jgi:hypothetical protein